MNDEIKGGRGLKVCAYYRMSNDEQKLSIGQQQKSVREFCSYRGWIIIEEYIDSGKSGSKDIAKRTEFHRMIANASGGKWSAIACYDTSRFGRLDTIDSAVHKSTLRKLGIHLETVNEGRIDWNTSMGRISDAVLSEQNHNYSVKLANDTVRGRHDIMSRGYWPIGEIPLGYDRELVEGDTVQLVIDRNKPFRKPRNWHTRLKVNTADAAIVRKIFKQFVSADVSARGLVKELNEDGVKSAGDGAWTAQMLLKTLREQAYIGRAVVGGRRKGNKEKHKEMEATVKEGACPTIIDADTFNRVQNKLATRGKANTSQAKAGALSGILICGHCGYRMDKRQIGASGAVKYVCSSGSKRQHLGCKQWMVREDDLLPIIAQELLTAVDVEVLNKLAAKPKEKPSDIDGIKATVDKLAKMYDRALDNLLSVDRELHADAQARAKRIKDDLDKSRNTLAMLEAGGAEDAAVAVATWWKENRDKLIMLSQTRAEYAKHVGGGMYGGSGVALKDHSFLAERSAVRDLLKALGATLTLHWSPRGERYHQLTTGVLAAQLDGFKLSKSYANAENTLYEGGISFIQSILIRRTLHFKMENRSIEGKFRGRNPNYIGPAYSLAYAV